MTAQVLRAVAYIGLAWVWVQPSTETVAGGARGDVWNSMWSLWFSHREISQGGWPWATDLLNAPAGGGGLLLDPLMVVFSPFAVPVLGVSGAYTALMLLRLAASGWVAHSFAAEWLAHNGLTPDAAQRAGWVAGVGYASAPVLLAGLQCGTTEAVTGAWPALAAWMCWRASIHGGRRPSVMAGLALLGAALASWYAVVVAFIFGGLLLVLSPGKRNLWPLVLGLCLTLPLAALAQASHSDAGQLMARSPDLLDRIRRTFGSADLLDFVWPLGQANLAIQSPAEQGTGYLHTVYLGIFLVLGAVTALLRRTPGSAAIALAGGVCAILALGPTLKFGGQTVLGWMPFALLESLPGFGGLSLLWRLGLGTGLAVALLAAAATRGHRAAVLAAVGLVLAEVALFSPISPGIARSEVAPAPALQALQGAPRGAVLTVPAFQHHADLWRQAQHGQPTTGTTHHRRSPAAIQWLQAARDQSLSKIQATAEAQGIRYLLIHKGTTLRQNPNRPVVQTIKAGLTPLAEDETYTVYALW